MFIIKQKFVFIINIPTFAQIDIMIQPNELRICNIVRVQEWDYNFNVRPVTHSVISTTITVVDSIHEHGINQYLPCGDAPEYIPYQRIFGLPLSPNMLDVCGFFTNFKKSMYMIKFGEDESLITLNYFQGEFRTSYYNVPVKTLHQLQNIFHALTGEELPIDIEKLKGL